MEACITDINGKRAIRYITVNLREINGEPYGMIIVDRTEKIGKSVCFALEDGRPPVYVRRLKTDDLNVLGCVKLDPGMWVCSYERDSTGKTYDGHQSFGWLVAQITEDDLSAECIRDGQVTIAEDRLREWSSYSWKGGDPPEYLNNLMSDSTQCTWWESAPFIPHVHFLNNDNPYRKYYSDRGGDIIKALNGRRLTILDEGITYCGKSMIIHLGDVYDPFDDKWIEVPYDKEILKEVMSCIPAK